MTYDGITNGRDNGLSWKLRELDRNAKDIEENKRLREEEKKQGDIKIPTPQQDNDRANRIRAWRMIADNPNLKRLIVELAKPVVQAANGDLRNARLLARALAGELLAAVTTEVGEGMRG